MICRQVGIFSSLPENQLWMPVSRKLKLRFGLCFGVLDSEKEMMGNPTTCEDHDDSVDGSSINAEEPRLRDIPFKLILLPRLLLLIPIRLYQLLISPALPSNTCRFYPTCSHYAYQAIYKHGAIKGGFLATWRLLRCNPFNPGGIDPVP